MTLFRKVDKVLAALGNIKAMERLHVDTFTENKINNIKGSKIAESREGVVYVKVQELNGYLFLETTILSRVDIKTFKGAKLTFTGDSNFNLKSDTQEIESNFSNVSNRFMTEISFDITEKEIQLINKKKFNKVVLSFKKKALIFFKV